MNQLEDELILILGNNKKHEKDTLQVRRLGWDVVVGWGVRADQTTCMAEHHTKVCPYSHLNGRGDHWKYGAHQSG